MAQQRLQKIIATRGYASRRKAEELILNNRVKVDGKIVNELGTKFEENVDIQIDNKTLYVVDKKYYYLFYKPRLVLTTMYDPKQRKTVADYFVDAPTRVYPVGRLDYDVSGMILMTNDGEFANFVMHPRYEFFKTYQAMCEGKVTSKDVDKLLKGVTIGDDNYFTKAIDAKLLKYDAEKNFSLVEMTIAEGRKHHVKNMFAAAEIKLQKLKRTKIEFLELGDLRPGEFRELKPHEVKRFYGMYQSVRRKEDN